MREVTPEGQPDKRCQEEEQQDAANANNARKENQDCHEQKMDIGRVGKWHSGQYRRYLVERVHMWLLPRIRCSFQHLFSALTRARMSPLRQPLRFKEAGRRGR
jgi:hypothetical protein